jgi:hypothetical protein
MMLRRTLGLAAIAALVGAPLASPLAAQAFSYPAMQPATITQREYNFILADGGGNSTNIAFQWREGLGNPKMMFVLDAGVGDVGNETALFVGGGMGYQLATASNDMPFDVLFTGNAGLAFVSDFNFLRIPIGVSAGRRFPLDGGFAITPFVHPRLSWNRVSGGGGSANDTELEVDLGANFEFKPRMAVRLSLAMGDSDAVGISFAWTPSGLR